MRRGELYRVRRPSSRDPKKSPRQRCSDLSCAPLSGRADCQQPDCENSRQRSDVYLWPQKAGVHDASHRRIHRTILAAYPRTQRNFGSVLRSIFPKQKARTGKMPQVIGPGIHGRTRSDQLAGLLQRRRQPPGPLSRLRKAAGGHIGLESNRNDSPFGRPAIIQTLPQEGGIACGLFQRFPLTFRRFCC